MSILIKTVEETEFPSNYTVIDIETTGLSYNKNEIIEISALKIRKDRIIDSFSHLIKPNRKIGSFITHLTGITNEMVANAEKIDKILPEFVKFLSDDTILGHNVKFDINFLQKNLENNKLERLKNKKIDTMLLARKYCKLGSHSLKNLAKHYNINISGHHRALNDCKITHNIYINIKKNYNPN